MLNKMSRQNQSNRNFLDSWQVLKFVQSLLVWSLCQSYLEIEPIYLLHSIPIIPTTTRPQAFHIFSTTIEPNEATTKKTWQYVNFVSFFLPLSPFSLFPRFFIVLMYCPFLSLYFTSLLIAHYSYDSYQTIVKILDNY